MRNSVFLSFIFSLLVIIHDLISRIQASTQARASAEESTSQVKYSWVSSAYIWYISLWDRIIAPRGRVYIQKMMGPKTDPCGTPKTSCDREERTLWMDTYCVRSLRYVSNMRNTDPDSPTCSFRKWSRISWSTVSKAADRSSNTRKTCFFLSTAIMISLCTLKSAVSVLWPLLYADCILSSRLFFSKCFSSWAATIFLITFDRNDRFETGRKFWKSSGSRVDFFKRGLTIADFSSEGK